MAHRLAEYAALHERVKELTCLYGLAQLSEHPNMTVEAILGEIVKLLPAAWQYPEIAAARIAMDGMVFETAGFREGMHRQSAKIQIGGQCRGSIDVYYLESRPEIDEGPFLKEERNLIEGIARQIALIVERRRARKKSSACKANCGMPIAWRRSDNLRRAWLTN